MVGFALFLFPRERILFNEFFKLSCYYDDPGSLVGNDRSVAGNSVADHLNYFGVYLKTEDDVFALQIGSMDFNSSRSGQTSRLGCKISPKWQRF